MSATELLQGVTQILYLLIFASVLLRAIQQPQRASINTALLFGAVAVIITIADIFNLLDRTPPRAVGALLGTLLMALPYLLLRLVDDFAGVPRWLLRASEAGLALSAVALAVLVPPLPGAVTLLLVLYFLGLQVYSGVRFAGTARHSTGVTRRRMQAVAAGSVFLGTTIFLSGLLALLPDSQIPELLVQATSLCSGLAYFTGFAPPAMLRRAWQEPELRAFLGRAARLPRLPDTAAIVTELETGAAAALGASGAAIGLWDESVGALRFHAQPPLAGGRPAVVAEGEPEEVLLLPGVAIGGRSFALGQALYYADTTRDDPDHAQMYASFGSRTAMCAPIIAGHQRLGVLSVYAARAPIFVEDDLALVQLLADQAAVILESRALIDEAARVRAREEVTRLKDDFLSAAAHDLKTPLTTLIGQAQLMERRAEVQPAAPADLAGIQRMLREARRLRTLVLELLDAARVDQGRLVGARERADLVALAEEVCERPRPEGYRCDVVADGPLECEVDPLRILQLIENLVENGIKYTPGGGQVTVRLWQHEGSARIDVTDHGIGIPAGDLPRLFERFHRGANVDDRRYSGMGLGLYICRGIAEQHGGSIAVTSVPGQGSTFHVSLPASVPALAAS